MINTKSMIMNPGVFSVLFRKVLPVSLRESGRANVIGQLGLWVKWNRILELGGAIEPAWTRNDAENSPVRGFKAARAGGPVRPVSEPADRVFRKGRCEP